MTELNPVFFEIKFETIANQIKRANGGRMRRLTTPEKFILIDGQAKILEVFKGPKWPVDTGDSQRAWDVVVSTRKFIGYIVTNHMYYSGWVHYAGARKTGVGPKGYPSYVHVWPQLKAEVEKKVLPDIEKQLREAAGIAEKSADVTKQRRRLEQIGRRTTIARGIKPVQPPVRAKLPDNRSVDLRRLQNAFKSKPGTASFAEYFELIEEMFT